MRNTKGKRFADTKHKNSKSEAKENIKTNRYDSEEVIPDNVSSNSEEYNTVLNDVFGNPNEYDNKIDYIDNTTPNKHMNSQNKKNKKRGKVKNFIFNFIIIICVIAIIISSYNIIVWFIENNKSKKMLEDIYGQVSVTEEEITLNDSLVKKRHYDIHKLLHQNYDTVGWLYVNNTNIDYPVVQTNDNDYYLTHSFDRSYNSAGWIFADYRCDFQGNGYNAVIYGHNRKDASMFGSLQRVLGEEWYSNEENLYINFSTLKGDHVYRIFSTFVCNDEDVAGYTQTNFASQEDFNAYVKMLERRSSHDFETDIENPNQILTLYTCYGLNNQRLLVCAVQVD